MKRAGRLLLALLLSGCGEEIPTYCLMPIELRFGEELSAYEFALLGRYAGDDTSVTKNAVCPGTFSGGDCDARGILLRDFDKQELVLNLTVFVGSEPVFEGALEVPPEKQCHSGVREVAVELRQP